MNIGIYIYDQAEVLDFAGPFEVFSTANRLKAAKPFNVFLVGETGEAITARGGFSVNPAYGFDGHPAIQVLIVVGGVHMDELKKVRVIDWIAKVAKRADLTASVCTGAFLLAKAGVITSQLVTTHWEDIPDLRTAYPALDVKEDCLWIDQGKIVTSAGISAGMSMSLHLVERLDSVVLAIKTARQMEFEWQP